VNDLFSRHAHPHFLQEIVRLLLRARQVLHGEPEVPDRLRFRSRGQSDHHHSASYNSDGTARITHVLYKANLSHDRLTKYLSQLDESGLLESVKEGDRILYRITERGSKFLMEFRRMEEFAEAFGLDI